MIRALVEAGIIPDLVIGTSVGALNGVQVATNPFDAANQLTRIWETLTRKTIFGAKTKTGVAFGIAKGGFGRQIPALCSPDNLHRLIEANSSVNRIEDLPIDTAIVATDLLVGKPKLLRRGALDQALLASAAIPGVFPPVKIDSVFYIDGGVAANVPVRQAVAAGAKSLIVLNANPAQLPGFVPRTAVEAVWQASMVSLRNQHADALEELANRYPIMQLPQPTPPAVSSFDFSHTNELIEAGFNSAKTFLGEFEDLADTTRSI
jgi:NTE family protein